MRRVLAAAIAFGCCGFCLFCSGCFLVMGAIIGPEYLFPVALMSLWNFGINRRAGSKIHEPQAEPQRSHRPTAATAPASPPCRGLKPLFSTSPKGLCGEICLMLRRFLHLLRHHSPRYIGPHIACRTLCLSLPPTKPCLDPANIPTWSDILYQLLSPSLFRTLQLPRISTPVELCPLPRLFTRYRVALSCSFRALRCLCLQGGYIESCHFAL